MFPSPVINSYGNTVIKRKSVSTIWGVLVQQGSNLYALGLSGKYGPSTLSATAFTLIETDIADHCQTAGSSVILRNNGTLWGSGDNTYGCLGFGDTNTSNYLNKWTQMSTAAFSGGVKKLGSNGSTLATFGIIDAANNLWMSGVRTPMGNGTTTNQLQYSTFTSVRSNVLSFSHSDASFGIVCSTSGLSYATGIDSSGTYGMFGNGRSTGTNANFEGTPTTNNSTALYFADVQSCGGTTIGLTVNGDLYVTGMGWSTSSGSVIYTNSTANHLYTFTKLASNVKYYAFGGTGGGGTYHGTCLAYTLYNGSTYYIGTNYNSCAALGSTAASVAYYTNPTIASYTLRGNSTFSWDGVYNTTPYQYAVYDTTAGVGMIGVRQTFSNTTGTMTIFLA